jgi:hypothetical protein
MDFLLRLPMTALPAPVRTDPTPQHLSLPRVRHALHRWRAGRKGRKGRNPENLDETGIRCERRLRPISGRNGQKPLATTRLLFSKTTFALSESIGTEFLRESGALIRAGVAGHVETRIDLEALCSRIDRP